jgi:hypothetical protein
MEGKRTVPQADFISKIRPSTPASGGFPVVRPYHASWSAVSTKRSTVATPIRAGADVIFVRHPPRWSRSSTSDDGPLLYNWSTRAIVTRSARRTFGLAIASFFRPTLYAGHTRCASISRAEKDRTYGKAAERMISFDEFNTRSLDAISRLRRSNEPKGSAHRVARRAWRANTGIRAGAVNPARLQPKFLVDIASLRSRSRDH